MLRQKLTREVILAEALDSTLTPIFQSIPADTILSIHKPSFAALMGAVLGQRISYRQARKLRGILYRVMNCVDFTPQDLLEYTALAQVIPDTAKCDLMYRLATYCHTHPEALCDNAKLDALIQQIPGVGLWTKETFKLVTFRDWDVFPAGDLFLRERVRRLLELKRRPTIAETKKIAERWAPHRSVVALYLWRWF